jgi:hypothetical protein
MMGYCGSLLPVVSMKVLETWSGRRVRMPARMGLQHCSVVWVHKPEYKIIIKT